MNKIIYMDAAASSLKSGAVINVQRDFLLHKYANSGRGIYALATNVDNLVYESRKYIADFINADVKQIVFTSGTTDSMNRIVQIIQNTIKLKNPTVVVSDLDHHSARMPWEYQNQIGKCKICVCPLTNGLDIDKTKIPMADIMVITAMSNVTGIAQDVSGIIKQARKKNPNVITIVDAAQYVVHENIDIKKFDCDFLCFSAHKIGGDTGLGVMFIKEPDKYNTDKFGGGMVQKILDKKWILNLAPEKFEAGTLPLTQIISLPTAIENLQKSKLKTQKIISFMFNELKQIKKINMLSSNKSKVISFTIHGMAPIDFGALLGANNICVRVGNMCASWIHKYLNTDGSIRLSCGFWNTMAEAKYVIKKIKEILK